jgi:hypothetical protein
VGRIVVSPQKSVIRHTHVSTGLNLAIWLNLFVSATPLMADSIVTIAMAVSYSR